MVEYREVTDERAWDELIEAHAGHPMQAWGWGELKARTGSWSARRIVVERDGAFAGAAQVLVRELPWPFGHICYAPRGPVAERVEDVPQVADDIAAWCKANVSAVSLKIDPAIAPGAVELGRGWQPSEQIVLPRTAAIDLVPTEDEIMAGLHSKKARQYIRKAGRSGVTVRRATAADLDAIMDIYHHTADTDDFALHSDEYYRTAFDACADVNQVFLAEIEGRPLAFLWNIATSGTAFELWGGVTDEGKRLRANYLLKWQAICTAKESGSARYDLNGLLEGGVSTFKLLFAGEPTVWMGAFDRPLSPLYRVWDAALKLYRRLFK